MKRILWINGKGGCTKTTGVLATLLMLLKAGLKAEIVDLDPQGTLTLASRLTKKFVPVLPEKATGDYLIYDSPPYRSAAWGGNCRNC